MKKVISILLIASAFLKSNAQDQLAAANNKLAIDLYQKLKSDDSNLFFSPISIDFALLSLHHGASGKTKEEFEQVLHLDQPLSDPEKKNFLSSHNKVIDNENLVNISNSLWINKNFNIREDFKNAMQTTFLSEIRPINVTNPIGSAEEINSWIADQTNNRIKDMVKPSHISPVTKLIVLNTVLFKGEWQTPLTPFIIEKNFYTINGAEQSKAFMGGRRQIDYFENDEIQVVKLPYKGAAKMFCVILPKHRNGITALEKVFDTSYLETIRKTIKKEDVALSLPKFHLEKSYSLSEPLQQLGLNNALNESANFTGISVNGKLNISEVIHKSFFEVNETHTEAAAATEATVIIGYSGVKKTEPPPPKIFDADHPFIFMIMDDQTNEILFMGKYVGE